MWHADINTSVCSVSNTNARFTGIKLSFPGAKILAISAYLPTSGKDDEFLDCLAELSDYITHNTDPTFSIILGLDSNCSEKSTSRRCQGFKDFCNDHSLQKICLSKPTFHHTNGLSESNIDYFLISQGSKCSLDRIFSQCINDYPSNFSSHDPIFASLLVPSLDLPTTKTDQYSHSYTDFTQSKVIWSENKIQEYQCVAAKILAEYEEFFKTPEFIPLKCQLYSNLLVKAAEVCLEMKKNTPEKKPRYPPRLHQAWMHLRRCFKIWKITGKRKDPSCESFLLYKQARGNFQHIRRYMDNLKTIKTNNTLMQTSFSDQKRYFSLIKTLCGKKKEQCVTELHTPAGKYFGKDTLEGFARDAELLAEADEENSEFDRDFYKLCIQDNHYIFEFKGEDAVKLPRMRTEDLENIIEKQMKRGKACDVYKLTAEHIKFCGKEAQAVLLNLMNDILDNIYYLTCPQVKQGLGTACYKGKMKPRSQSSSYRRITVTPQLGSILDRYIDPIAEKSFQKYQSPDQYGFTKNISYIMAALLRGECQRWALDTKTTCFGVSFDGKAAFPSVNRDIQIRELYSCGESGDLLQYSRNIYQNTFCNIKQDGKLSREFQEHKGSRQGHKRASGHFKTYVNPCLTAANSAGLGFYIGSMFCVVCVADDTYILSGDPRSLQALVDIIGHYGKRYRLTFGADKTVVTVTGSKHDILYYQDINIWSLYGEKLAVKEDNSHLGLIVSGVDEEVKNVDKNLKSTRQALFIYLGNIFAFKCKISPAVQYHTWSIFIKPVLRSGLAALPVRPTAVKSITAFHHKVLRAILKLSAHSPVAPLYFLLGELPLEASLHLDVLGLFWNVWTNPQTKCFEVTKYLLQMAGDNSLTWAAHVKILFLMYNLPNPLELLSSTPWSKNQWKEYTKTKVTCYWEAMWRSKAVTNTKLAYLNVQTVGLSGQPHPMFRWVSSTRDVTRVRPHVKMLSGDYLCYANLAHDRDTDPHCCLCLLVPAPKEDLVHVLTMCSATRDTRSRLMPDLFNTIASFYPSNGLLNHTPHSVLTQFILDCSSLNLPADIRVPPAHPGYVDISRQCSNLIFTLHKDRTRQLKAMNLLG